MIQKKSHARTELGCAMQPNEVGDDAARAEWLKAAVSGFVSPSKANRKYYKAILMELWPKGHGIPGPLVDEKSIRKAVDKACGRRYVDTFRRVRELQGEEGFKGIIKDGAKYQLQDLTISEKRNPRVHLLDADWSTILEAYDGRCAACGRTPEEMRFQQDHKVPRLRGGGDNIENWQPLCDECNNFKSTSCRDCHEDCSQCCWAYPEFYKPFKIPGKLIKKARDFAKLKGVDADEFVSDAISRAMTQA